MTDANLAPHSTQCSVCDQADNHPKHHYGDRRFHFDCLPADVYEDSFAHLPAAERKRIDTLIAHAHGESVDHLHGDALRAKHIEINPGLKAHRQAASTAKGGRRG